MFCVQPHKQQTSLANHTYKMSYNMKLVFRESEFKNQKSLTGVRCCQESNSEVIFFTADFGRIGYCFELFDGFFFYYSYLCE